MALLTGKAIQAAVQRGEIVITPFDPSLVGTNSYDCHLGDSMSFYSNEGRLNLEVMMGPGSRRTVWNVIDSRNPPPLVPLPLTPIPGTDRAGWVILPGRLYLSRTREYTETWGFVPRIDGRSTCGRLGVFGHITAGQGDNGFCGTWTLEITSVEPVVIYPGDRLFQLRYDTQEGEPTFYGKTGNTSGRYQKQEAPTAAKVKDG